MIQFFSWKVLTHKSAECNQNQNRLENTTRVRWNSRIKYMGNVYNKFGQAFSAAFTDLHRCTTVRKCVPGEAVFLIQNTQEAFRSVNQKSPLIHVSVVFQLNSCFRQNIFSNKRIILNNLINHDTPRRLWTHTIHRYKSYACTLYSATLSERRKFGNKPCKYTIFFRTTWICHLI